MKRRIGILTSGGDCPGLNAAIRGVDAYSSIIPTQISMKRVCWNVCSSLCLRNIIRDSPSTTTI